MIHLAMLNENNICEGIKTVKEMIADGRHIEIPTPDFDSYIWKKYENDQWSIEKFVPDYAQIELSRMEKLEQSQSDQDEIIMNLLLGGI